jgi:DNA-binding CsgD family transcriptional regulator
VRAAQNSVMDPGPLLVAVVSPQAVVRHGLVDLLARHPDRVVVVPYPDGAEPDVVLYDVVDLVDGDLSGLQGLLAATSAVGLTRREVEVLTLIAQGRSNRDIAAELYLSPNSIKTYVRTAYRKIGATSRSQAVAWAIRHGFPVDGRGQR